MTADDGAGAAARDRAPKRQKALMGPLIAALLVVSPLLPLSPLLNRPVLRPGRSDLPWLLAIVALIVVSLVTLSLRLEVFGVALAYLALKGGVGLEQAFGRALRPVTARASFLWALAVLLGFAVVQALLLGALRAQGPPWLPHPNVFGHVMLVVGFMAAAGRRPGARWLVLVATLAGVLLTGSRSALVGGAVTVLVSAVMNREWRGAALRTATVAIAAVALTSLLFPASPWAQRVLSPVYSALGLERPSKNLLVWTESLDDAKFWNQLGVASARASPARVAPTVWSVTRVEPIAWARPQQAVEVDRGVPHTLSAAFRHMGPTQPGFIGWAGGGAGSAPDDASFEVALGAAAGPTAVTAGLDSAVTDQTDLADGWTRLRFSFVIAGEGSARLGVGVSPGIGSATLGDSVEVREVQLETGSAVTAYAPAIPRTSGVGEALARIPIFRTAWRGITEAPLVGHGSGSFPAYYATDGGAGPVPAHAHNAYLDALFASGVVGLLALLSLLAALLAAGGTVQAALLCGVCVANLFDSTLAGPVIYLLAFVAPLRSLPVAAAPESGSGT